MLVRLGGVPVVQSRCQTSSAQYRLPSSSTKLTITSSNHFDQRALTSVPPTLPKAVAMSGWHST